MIKNRKRRNRAGGNRGITLVELVVAMALFVIVIVPICASFITSMRVNQKSRKMMAANDIAQSIVDGFSGKTYESVKSSINYIGSSDLSGNSALAIFGGTVSEAVSASANIYNRKTNGVSVSWNGMNTVKSKLGSVSSNEIVWDSVAITTPLLISENRAEAISMNRAAAADFKAIIDGTGKPYTYPMLMGVTNDTGNVSFLCYTGLHSEGYYFDAVVQFVPVAQKTGDTKYYTYEAMVYIYEIDNTDHTNRLNEPVLSLMTGIKNKNG